MGTVYLEILFGSGLLFYLIFSAYSIYLVYTGVVEENTHIITKIIYYLGVYNILLWTGTFTSMLLVKLGKLLFS